MSSWAWKSGGLTAGTAYSTSKGAVTSLTFSVARQYAGDGITCNGVAPCYVFSPMIMEQLTACGCVGDHTHVSVALDFGRTIPIFSHHIRLFSSEIPSKALKRCAILSPTIAFAPASAGREAR